MLTHSALVTALVKPAQVLHSELTPSDTNLIHMTMGISGEAGELLDAIKKSVIYRKPLDRTNVIEELGDIEFYLEGLRQELCITREECLTANITKLSERYKKLTFTNEAAIAREDKQ
jgi:NTP pyrophosphatase (non-canonical NTP hydrolase)